MEILHTPAPRKRPVKGVKVRTLNLLMILISCVLYITLLAVTFRAAQNYRSMVAATDLYIRCQQNAALVSDGSDYLTDQVRMFTVTLDPTYAKNYFTEVNVTRRRDQALEDLGGQASLQAGDFLQAALDFSNRLTEREIYAMRLAAEAEGMHLTALPAEIGEAELSPAHQKLSPEEKLDAAREMVFGTEYQANKQLISTNIDYFLSDVLQATQVNQETSMQDLQNSMRLEQVFFSILFVQNVFIFIMIIFLIVKPLQVYVNCIQEEKLMEITGAYEFKYLALTYNNIYELNAANEQVLRHQAEHDPLTGIMNRGAFDQVKEVLRVKAQPIAILIIDVDKFKLINDGYGHETGDRVLKRVAKLLEENFRTTDFASRIGGDEFSVILTEIDPSQQAMVERKMNAINQTLLNPTDNLPQVSLSTGGAFSATGYTDELYQQADAALYQVKEHGRCSCRFYEEGMPFPGKDRE
ncbi:sensor domain-containing diguanylate cyclase [Acutalibacter caecimuris]|uniref:sensor domain-containing diguanylate cyclase n=1 Tax=Acutalibacter caecimuris TaxID=3093657 RepID=UPI002AC9DBD4|nr:GGDEF domain-containing protein [Acutalibacter sp. M00118]